MESLQLAQMLADISDLSAVDTKAAASIVQANETLKASASTTHISQPTKLEQSMPVRHHNRAVSASMATSSNRQHGTPARFDMIGRMFTPPLTRSNSAQNSTPGTPRRESEHEDDVERANRLMTLYDIRAKLKQQDNTSLLRAREKVNAMIAKQQSQMPEGAHHTKPKYTYPRLT